MVFYQIFPHRFASSPRLAKPDYLEAWDTPPTLRGYKGGDLYGIIEHLEHIETLGANALYLTPIFQAASNHRYNTHDYYQVDPMQGGTAAFTGHNLTRTVEKVGQTAAVSTHSFRYPLPERQPEVERWPSAATDDEGILIFGIACPGRCQRSRRLKRN